MAAMSIENGVEAGTVREARPGPGRLTLLREA